LAERGSPVPVSWRIILRFQQHSTLTGNFMQVTVTALRLPKNGSKYDHARAYAKAGMRIFPIKAGGRTPDESGWQDRATCDLDQVETWWTTNPNYNIGVATGRGLAVIDADVKKGAQGLTSLMEMQFEWLPDSLMVDTPSGGRHVYLQIDRPVGNSVKRLADYPGIDIRGDGGYVVGAGSTVKERQYRIVPDSTPEPATAPTAFYDLAPHARQSASNPNPAINPDDLDHPHLVDRAIEYLHTSAPEAIEGDGGNQSTFITACYLRDLGISEPAALDLLLEHWNEDKASPPWQPDELETLTHNAFRYAKGQQGARTAYAEFGIDEIPKETLERSQTDKRPSLEKIKAAGALPGAEATRKTPPSAISAIPFTDYIQDALTDLGDPLIEGLIDQETLVVLFGDSNIGKSFLLLDMLYAIGTGADWNGRETAKGIAFYVAGEGGRGLKKRLLALAREMGATKDDPPLIAVIDAQVDMFGKPEDVDGLIRTMRAASAQMGQPIRAIAFDTMARTIGDGDENSNKDVGVYLQNVDRIRKETGATAIVVHHTGKDKEKGARGASAIRGNIDTQLEVALDPNGWVYLNTRKQRDMEELKTPILFKLEAVELGQDAKGRTVSSCVINYSEGGELAPLELSAGDAELLEALKKASVNSGRKAVPWSTWMDVYRGMVDADIEASGISQMESERTLKRRRSTLVESGHVCENGHGKWQVVVD
jgi:hypothetical protein